MNCLRNSRSLLSTSPPLRPRGYHSFRVLPRDRPAQRFPQSTTQTLARRFKHAGPQKKEMTRGTGHRGESQWYENVGVQAAAAALVVLGSSAAVAAVFCRREAVPYTNRSRLIILTPNAERRLGEYVFKKEKKKLNSKILSPLDPESVRVRRIAEEIVGAVYRNLASHHHLDASYRDENREKPRGAQVNLDGLDWEVIVVRDKMINAMCAPGGKIIVYTGLLDKFSEDAEVATVLGHEVGHAIARHTAENLTMHLWFMVVEFVISLFITMPEDVVDIAWKFFLQLPFSRRMEMEADHIGLMLLAAAGYDPRVAPSVFEKLGNIGGDSKLQNYISTHPSSEKRSRLLSQEHVMREAIQLLYSEYCEVGGSEGTEGFPLDSGTQVKDGKEISCTNSAM